MPVEEALSSPRWVGRRPTNGQCELDDNRELLEKIYDLSIEGPSITIRCKGTLRVNGNIEANIHCMELLIGDQAVTAGSITAEKVVVPGRVKGAIFGDSVVLHSTAHVDGDIHSHSLTIEEGAKFDGRSRNVVDRAEVAPQLEPSKLA